MWARAIAAWLLILFVAILSGGVRERFIHPRYGNFAAELFGATVLSVTIFLAALTIVPGWFLSPGWLSLLWVTMTVSFEFLFFHYVVGHSWSELLAAYRFWEGRLWVVVLAVLGLAPFAAHRWLEIGAPH